MRTFRGGPILLRWLLSCFLITTIHAAGAAAVDAEAQQITLSLATEPPTLNSLRSTDQISSFVLSHVMEGLMRYDARGDLVGGVAERWELREDGATFWLRDDARWSDGRPVTAADFVFAWRRALEPTTASQYAFILYPIANAEAVNRGEKPLDALGVQALGAHRLEVQFARPTTYFLSLTAFMTYYPIREDFFRAQGERYAADAHNLLFNGPFTLSRWVHSAHLTLSKNPEYWGRGEIALQTIDLPYITSDPSATFNLFKNGDIAMAALDVETLDDALERGYPIHQFQSGSLFFLSFNFREGRLTGNYHLRKAIQYALDPDVLVNQVIGLPGVQPGRSLFPRTVRALDGRFRDHFPAPLLRPDLDKAQWHLQQALDELGLKQVPPLVFLTGEHPRAGREAEYVQYVLRQALGIDLKIDRQTFKQRIERMSRGDFDIVSAAWGPDFDDAITFGDLFSSWNENNRGLYRNPEYDRWVRVAMESGDDAVRMNAMAELQRIVVEDVPILPLYESAMLYVTHPRLLGLERSIFGGDPVLRYVRIRD